MIPMRYSPEVIHVGGMSGILTSLFGKPQSWYDNINNLQKQLTLLLTEITAVGKDIWNTIAGKLAEAGGATRVGLKYFSDYDWTTNEIVQGIKNIIVTADHEPTDYAINLAKLRVEEFTPQVAYVKRVAPELVAQIEADRAKAEANLAKSRLVSPAEAGEKEFYRAIEEQAGKIGQFGFGMGLAIVGIAALALMGGRRRNPAQKSIEKIAPLALVGGLAWAAFAKPSSASAAIPGVTVAAALPTAVPPPKSYDEAVKGLDDIKTMYRSGRLDEGQAVSEANKLLESASAVVTPDQYETLRSAVLKFTGDIVG